METRKIALRSLTSMAFLGIIAAGACIERPINTESQKRTETARGIILNDTCISARNGI